LVNVNQRYPSALGRQDMRRQSLYRAASRLPLLPKLGVEQRGTGDDLRFRYVSRETLRIINPDVTL
jgi:hypothetical protein